MSPKKTTAASKKGANLGGASVHRTDASMIISRLATIEDPTLSYFLGMVVDRVAQLVDSRRKVVPPVDKLSLADVLAVEPHGVLYRDRAPGDP